MPQPTTKKLITHQESRAAEIGRIQERFNATTLDALNVNIVKKRIDTVDKIWDEARETHAEIIARDDVANDPYVTNQVFALMEVSYESLQDSLLKALTKLETPLTEKRRSTEIDDSDTDHRTAKLPKLDLPKFSGRYEDWDNFCDLFTSLVHEAPRLTNVTKLQYLRSCLTDNAADFVKDVSTTNANYLSTWQALKTRYSNPRLTVNNHLTALLGLPYLKKESANELQSFSDEAQRIVRALKNLDMPVQHWNIWLVYLLASRLDPESRKIWESELSVKDRQAVARASEAGTNLSRVERFASFDDFIEFLDQRSNALCMIASEAKINKGSTSLQSKSSGNSKRSFHTSAGSKSQGSKGFIRKCSLCSEDHYIGACQNFLEKSISERRNEARRLRLCFNCLGAHHAKNCESKRRCLTCNEKHHSSLHTPPNAELPKGSAADLSQTTPANVSVLTANLSVPKHSVVLATAQVILTGPSGTEVRVRALLDQDSEASFVTESIVQLLGLPRNRTQISLSGLGASAAGTARSTAQISLRSIHDSTFLLETHALVLPRLTSQLPSRQLLQFDISQFDNLSLADPHFFKPDSVDLILGSDIYCQILRSGLKRFPSTSLIAQDTALGWVVSGSINCNPSWRADLSLPNQSASVHFVQNDDLQNSLEKFWKLEDISVTSLKGKPEDILCEQFYVNNSSRSPDGRYMVRLPLNSDPPNASSETRQIALSTLFTMHRRFDRDLQLADAYREFMRVYEELGHMEKVPEPQINNPRAWYIPHHAVIQRDPWKFRVVFNASRPTKENVSLNDCLMSGPALQGDITLILLQWRLYRFVFTADIVKMFRQIQVHPEDRDLQRILWSPNQHEPPIEYRLTTVTYGTACAPYLSIRTLMQLVQDEKHRFPLGAHSLENNAYVDEFFDGADDIELAVRKRDELSNILLAAGIELDKWSANCSELLPPQTKLRSLENDKQIARTESVKTLGLHWNTKGDAFEFSFTKIHSQSYVPTKRSVLSIISQLFDPLGWLAPIIITAEIIMQDLWILKSDWDSPLPPDILRRWLEYSNAMSAVTTISISRWLGTLPSSRCQIHGFADASSRAYAAVVYLKVSLGDNESHISLLAAKTKISPVKTISIPNLELNAAALLVKLICRVRELLVFKDFPVFAWSDSQVVLSWLRKHPCHWKTFVANRVALIQTELPSAEWRHVPTRDNPADLATRGVKPIELSGKAIWWNGPKWLASSAENWPKQPETSGTLHVLKQYHEPEILSRFSSLSRLTRVVAYCRRPLVKLRDLKIGRETNTSFLTASELMEARYTIIRLAQSAAFSSEIEHLKIKESLPKRNPLRKLNPFVGEDGILRVGGRLHHSSLPRETKHPPILPHRSALSRLFVHQN